MFPLLEPGSATSQRVEAQRSRIEQGQAIHYELGLLYEAQEQWSQAAEMYESIPTFHDVPDRLESVLARRGPAQPVSALRYAN